jgi:hypothetical protein
MKDIKQVQPPGLDKEPGKPGYKPGTTGNQEKIVQDVQEDVEEKSPQVKEKQMIKDPNDKENKKIVNEQEENKITNDDTVEKQTTS